MKNLTPKSLRFIPAALALVFTLLANHARATITTWDPQGTATQSPYKSSLSQTWENAEWSTATSEGGVATPVNWVEGTSALFAVNSGTGTPAFTVTMNANHTVAGIFDGPDNPNPCPVTLSGTGTIVLPSGTQDFWVSSDTSDPGSLTINNVIAGSGGIQWSADGLGVATLVLNGANTFSGGFYIDQGGNATFGNNAAFGTGAITWSVAGYISSGLPGPYNIGNAMTHLAGIETFGGLSGVATTFSGNWTLPSSGTVTLENIQGTITVSGPISGAAALTINHASTGWSFNGANTFSGALTITAGTLTIGGSGSLTSGGTSGTYSPNIANAGTFTYASSASQTLSGVISGAGTLNQSAGTLILSGANTYTGVTTLSGGILNLNHSETAGTSGPMGNSAASNPGSIVLSGGTLQYSTANNNHDYSGRFSTAANQAYKIDVNSADQQRRRIDAQ
jgi:autotransporter-associated beta strand protein